MQSPPPILDGELLRAFAAFADTLNFTRAARRVGLSQPALFERVQRLGQAIDARLYEREGKLLRLTDHGVSVAAHARESLARADSFMRSLRGEAASEAVTLAAGEGAFLYLLGPALARSAGDATRLTLLTLGAPAAAEAVQSGAAHLAVGVIDVAPAGLVARDIVRTPLCAALPRRHRLARRRVVRLADLAGERAVLPPAGSTHRDFAGRAIAGLGADAPPLEADGWPLMLQFVALGLGVAVVNGICCPPRGVILRRIPELGSVVYRLLSRRTGTPSAATARLSERILELGRAASRPA